MLKILFQPYPQKERTFGQSLLHSSAEGLFVFLFFLLFQPFGLSEWHSSSKFVYLIGIGLNTALASLITKKFIPMLFPSFFKEENWVVWKEIVSIVFLLAFITFLVLAYSSYFLGWKLTFSNGLNLFLWVAIIGIFPTTFWVMYDYIGKIKKYAQPIQVVHHDQIENAPSELKLIAENEKDSLTLLPQQLLYIESTDNYSTIFYLKENLVEKQLLRSSLSRLETQIQNELIVRCHRSYIVNLENVEQISGNAQGYKLHLKTAKIVIPVARKYSFVIEKIK